MRIAIILSGNLVMQPYIKYYTDVFDSLNMDYEYVCWDRDFINPIIYNNHKVIAFNISGSIKNKQYRKLYDYYRYSQFVRNHIDNSQYDFLLIHTITSAVFLNRYLNKNFNFKYIFDIRDYSIIYPFVKKKVTHLITNSIFTAISSLGYLNWLPKENSYVLSHNVSKSYLETTFKSTEELFKNDKINILTIGQIRDFSSNKRVIKALGNKNKIKMIFAGSGIEKEKLEYFAMNKYTNIVFTGRYKKEEESFIVQSADFINIVLPIDVLSNTLISNRFYLGILHRKPIIVNEESFQANYVKKFNLGLIVKSEDDIYEKLIEYINNFDFKAFNKGCNDIIEIIKKDITIFENYIINMHQNAHK